MTVANPTIAYKPNINKPGDEIESLSYIKLVIHAPSGTGKSTLAGTASLVDEMKDVLHINTGDEISALRGAEEVALTGTNIVGVPEPDSIDFESALQMDQLRWWLLNEDHPYKTIIIDTISRIDQIILDQTVQQSIRRNPNLASGERRDLNDTNRDDYGKRKKTMIRMMGNFQELPMNVIMLAHTRTFEQEGKPAKIAPDLSENISDALTGMFNIVGYLSITPIVKKDKDGKPVMDRDGKPITENHRILTTETGGSGLIAKDRTPGQKLGRQIIDPTMEKIFNLINKERKNA